MNTPIAYQGLAHTTLPVHDLALAERFYVELLGGTLQRRFDRETFLRDRPERADEADADNDRSARLGHPAGERPQGGDRREDGEAGGEPTQLLSDNSPLHVEVAFGSCEVHLFLQRRFVPRTPTPHPHTAFGVSPAVLDEVASRLREAGAPMDGPRRLGPPGHASLYFVDPFGHLLELTCMGYRGAIPFGPPDIENLAERFHATANAALA